MASFPRNRQDVKRGGYKNPIRSLLRSPCEGNYNLYKSARQKEVGKSPAKEGKRQGKKITFPLCLRFMPPLTRDEAAMDGGGLLQEASRGFCGWGKQERPRRIQPFLCFSHSLRRRTFDQPTMTGLLAHYVRGPSRWKALRTRKQTAGSRNEDWTIWIGVCCGIHEHWTTPKRTSCLSIKFFFLHLTPLPLFSSSAVLFSTAWSSLGPRAHVAHTALSVWMQLIIQREKFVPVEKLSLLAWLVNANKKQRRRTVRGHHMLREPFRHVPNKNAAVRALLNASREWKKSRMEKIKERGEKTSFTSSSIITPNEE